MSVCEAKNLKAYVWIQFTLVTSFIFYSIVKINLTTLKVVVYKMIWFYLKSHISHQASSSSSDDTSLAIINVKIWLIAFTNYVRNIPGMCMIEFWSLEFHGRVPKLNCSSDSRSNPRLLNTKYIFEAERDSTYYKFLLLLWK